MCKNRVMAKTGMLHTMLRKSLLLLLLIHPSMLTARQASGSHPPFEYLITVFSDRGMHLIQPDYGYLTLSPPGAHLLAQIVKTGTGEQPPWLLTETDLREKQRVLFYQFENNSHSEGPKLAFWSQPWDANSDGDVYDPGDWLPAAVWQQRHLPETGGLQWNPANVRAETLRPVVAAFDHSPAGDQLAGGRLHFTGPNGAAYARTDSSGKITAHFETMRGLWLAADLPVTPFYDGSAPLLRGQQEQNIRPFQKAIITLARWLDSDRDGRVQKREIRPVRDARSKKPVQFFGTVAVDIPGCVRCHASEQANGEQYGLWKAEFTFWSKSIPGTSAYMANQRAAAVSILEIHDRKHGTDFLARYDAADRSGVLHTRLGRSSVLCADCHGKTAEPVAVSLHKSHLGALPRGDVFGRPVDCQSCHAGHKQSGSLLEYALDQAGLFRGGDIREYRGGRFLGRDVHANPAAQRVLKTRSHLTAAGEWLKANVMLDGRGLYCSNCHNMASQLLAVSDSLEDVLELRGRTLRDRPLPELLAGLRKAGGAEFDSWQAQQFFDPLVSDTAAVALPWLNKTGLLKSLPRCADCHQPPFVESLAGIYPEGGKKGMLERMSFSAGHAGLACSSCHQSAHGQYPVAASGVDPVTLEQARSLNPDGSPGPVTCAACHVVDSEGVPLSLPPAALAAFPAQSYPTRYEKAVAWAHTRRSAEEKGKGSPR